MMRKNVKWNQGEKQQRVFEELKEKLMIEPVLITLELNKEMRVEEDVSDIAIGGVLSIKHEDEKQRSVAIFQNH